MPSLLLSTAYFPPTAFFSALALRSWDHIYLEACGTYHKQSLRNRCRILTSGGIQTLSVPLVHEQPRPVDRWIRIDYSTRWVENHQRAIATAYGLSAYFDYYRDELFALLGARPATLWELNASLLDFALGKLGLRNVLEPTTEFRLQAPEDGLDLRENISPVVGFRAGVLPQEKPRYQIFSGNGAFVEGLSVLDLLMNEGPEGRFKI